MFTYRLTGACMYNVYGIFLSNLILQCLLRLLNIKIHLQMFIFVTY